MQLSDLVEMKADARDDAGKALIKEYRDLAKKYDLTIKTPQYMSASLKDGQWFGGAFTPMGGDAKDQDHLVEYEFREKGFIQALAKKLEGYISDGRTCLVALNGDRQAKGATVLKAGEVHEQLNAAKIVADKIGRNSFDNNDRPRTILAWFTGWPTES